MKKLMIAAAIVCAAAMSHAAAVTWNAEINEFDSNWNPAVGTVILATGADSWTLTFDEIGMAAEQIEGDTAVGGIFAQGTEWTATMTAQLFNEDMSPAGQYTLTKSFTIPALTGDPTQDEATLGQLSMDIGTAFVDGNTGALPTAEAAKAAGWAAAPEPTSGLLLLIGVAGLALRRRRA